jgi:hypothetical protein
MYYTHRHLEEILISSFLSSMGYRLARGCMYSFDISISLSAPGMSAVVVGLMIFAGAE